MRNSQKLKDTTIFSQTRNYRIASLLSILFVIVEVICIIFIPRFTQDLLDKGIREGVSKQSSHYIWVYSGILFGLAMLSLLSGMASGYFASKASAGLAKNLRLRLFQKIQGFSFENYDQFSSGTLISRLTNDITNIQNSYMMVIRALIRNPFLMVGAIIMAFITSPKLAWILVVILIGLTIILMTIIIIAFPRFNKMLLGNDLINNKIKENIAGIKTIKTFVTEKQELQEFKATSERVKKLAIRAEKLVALNSPVMVGTIFISLFFIMLISINVIVKTKNQGEISIGILTSFISYMFQVLMSLMIASMVLITLTISKASAKRITEVLKTVSNIQNPNKPIYLVNEGKIEFKDVDFKYHTNKKRTLKNINLTINPGETIGLIGSTGSGKSSFVNLIPRLYDVTNGQILIDNKDVRDYDLFTLRDSVAIVLQKNTLFNGTIRENIKWGKEDATDLEIEEALKDASAYDFIFAKQGLDTLVEEKGANFSGGQKQRLCIARALIKKPKILILDDSTSAVDNQTDRKIRDTFNNKFKNTTKIIIAQRISSIQNADKIIVMQSGQVQAFDTHKNLLKTNEFYKHLYQEQSKEQND
ncbi:ABC transporter ATP-binding protein [Mycoplasmopsis gallopavonis]|uniref:ABC-type multidrug/protein/lipid transport system ATPase component n=1 Tax=Mycoplasmopsis gallopavonis TaxID=76629 RepID=A0A449AZW9_9BACT|nr:ABC transporter ATP-binding protein [Mycoplasmopsis gallopavonis]RIV16231.1 ABC transporter ATP-binding protein [Mycoplasmopsis gallopavonis]VEU73051.1 ABC-type multidrug/protein/lipid transport system ATPase component [Mycoplasmopsis gallopavonis]